MRFALERTAEPDIEPIDLHAMKRSLRVFDDIDTDDEAIQELITGARQWVERETGRACIDQTWRLTLAPELGDVSSGVITGTTTEAVTEILLRRSPVLAIESFVSVGADGEETAVDPASYELRESKSKWPKVVGLNGTTFASGTYRITFRAGYAERSLSPQQAGEVVPVLLKQAMRLWAEAHYTRDPKSTDLLLKTAEGLLCGESCHVGIA